MPDKHARFSPSAARPVSDYFSDDFLKSVQEYVNYCIGEIEDAKHDCPDPYFAVEGRVNVSAYPKNCGSLKGRYGHCREQQGRLWLNWCWKIQNGTI